MATVLSTIQRVCLERLGKPSPNNVYSSTERMWQEIGSIANTVAEMAAAEYDWKALKEQATITGDGTTTAFDLPSDYSRMLKKANLWSNRLETALTHVVDTDRWLELLVRGTQVTYGAWTLIGSQIHINAAPVSGEVIKYYYVSNKPALSDGGSGKALFTLDTDTFKLSEKLLFHGIAWKYRESKGLPYAEDMANYEVEKERLITADGGSKVLRYGNPSVPRDVQIAYPRTVGV